MGVFVCLFFVVVIVCLLVVLGGGLFFVFVFCFFVLFCFTNLSPMCSQTDKAQCLLAQSYSLNLPFSPFGINNFCCQVFRTQQIWGRSVNWKPAYERRAETFCSRVRPWAHKALNTSPCERRSLAIDRSATYLLDWQHLPTKWFT